jgi:hypothetical protein
MVPRPMAQPSGSPVLYVVLGAMGVALLGLGGFVLYQRLQEEPAPPPTQAQVTTLTTMLPSATAATPPPTPPPTPEPKPTFKPAEGKGAAALRRAQASFSSGNYDGAVAQAQEALKADPGNSEASRVLESALNGQSASAHFAAARTALAQNDFERARSETDAGRKLAPWDQSGTDLLDSIQRAEQRVRQRAQQQQQQARVAQINELLNQADRHMTVQEFDAAISLYDQVLEIEPGNQRAGLGRTNAVGAKAVAAAAAAAARTSPAAAGKAFVASATQASSSQTSASNLPPGFEETPGVSVKKGTQAAELPGKIRFDVSPKSPKPGDKYTVEIGFANEGAAPIQIESMMVTTTINGKKRSGAVPPLVKDVAPRQSAQLLVLPDFWREDTSSWTMEVTVRTTRGETYKNKVDWR